MSKFRVLSTQTIPSATSFHPGGRVRRAETMNPMARAAHLRLGAWCGLFTLLGVAVAQGQVISAIVQHPAATADGGLEYRALQDATAAAGDLHALRFANGNAQVLWRAAEQLRRLSPNERVILTYDPAVGGVPFRYGHLNASQRAVLDQAQVDWLRGVGNARRLGPILGSRPVFVGPAQGARRSHAPYPIAGSDAYAGFVNSTRNRPALVYVGANDGMLHGFDAANGAEVFAYVPNKLIDGGQRFATRLDARVAAPDDVHALVDLTPGVEDVFMRPAAGVDYKAWRTVLIGGLGAGGKGYFALDVTDPDASFRSEAEGVDAVLWEFTDADDFHPADPDGNPLVGADGRSVLDEQGAIVKDLGYARSQARIAMSNLQDVDGQQRWTALFGNGPRSTAGRAVLFVLFIDQGMDGWRPQDMVKLSSTPALAPDQQNGLGEPALLDLDLNGTVDLAYAGDLLGNLHRFDLSSLDAARWTASIVFRATSPDGAALPISERPLVLRRPGQPGFIILFAAGGCSADAAAADGAAHSLFGIVDSGSTETPASAIADHQITNILGDGDRAFARQRVVSPDSARQVGRESAVMGWRLDFAADAFRHSGGCARRRLFTWGGLLFVAWNGPDGQGGAVLPINPATGLSPRQPVMDLNGDGDVNEEDLAKLDGNSYAPGVLFDEDELGGPFANPQVLQRGNGAALALAAGQERRVLAFGAPLHSIVGRLSWRELTDLD